MTPKPCIICDAAPREPDELVCLDPACREKMEAMTPVELGAIRLREWQLDHEHHAAADHQASATDKCDATVARNPDRYGVSGRRTGE